MQWACHSLCAEARSLLLSFYCLGSGDWTQLLSNLNGPTPLTAQGLPFPHPASHRYPWNTPQYDRRSLVDATAETERPAALLCNTHLFASVFYMRFLLGHDHHHKSADFENLWCFPNPKIIYVVNFPVTLLSVFSKIKAPKIPNHLWNKHAQFRCWSPGTFSFSEHHLCVRWGHSRECWGPCPFWADAYAQAEMPPLVFHSDNCLPVATVSFLT